MDIRLRFSERGLWQVTERLDQLLARVHNAEPVLRQAADYMVRSSRHRIHQSKVDPNGSRWPDLDPKTIRIRELQGDSNPENILVRTGKLARSIRVAGVNDHDFKVIADPVDRRGKSYASYHQEGTQRMAQRIILGFSQRNITTITQMVNRYMAGGEAMPGGDE